MSFELIGTEYGGWVINLELIPAESVVVSAGIGEDISFDLQLINSRNCKIIGIDPTPKSHRFIESQNNLDNFELIKMALHSNSNTVVKIHKNRRRSEERRGRQRV